MQNSGNKNEKYVCKEISAKYEHEINKIKKKLSVEYNLRSSKEQQINELEQELKVNRESIHNELLGKINAIQTKLHSKENELRNLQDQYEVAAKKYYPLQRRCENGESFYNMECKEAGELRGSLETIKLKIGSLTKSIENDNNAFNLLLKKSKEI
jgi:chromosome segregation ATPase